MSFEYPDTLYFEGHRYATLSQPLMDFRGHGGMSSAFQPRWPSLPRGYIATWRVEHGRLLLTALAVRGRGDTSGDANQLACVFPDSDGTAVASWVTGSIFATRGAVRYLGTPPSRVHDHELSLQLVAGAVHSVAEVDSRDRPDPTDDELRANLPAFLWPTRLRD